MPLADDPAPRGEQIPVVGDVRHAVAAPAHALVRAQGDEGRVPAALGVPRARAVARLALHALESGDVRDGGAALALVPRHVEADTIQVELFEVAAEGAVCLRVLRVLPATKDREMERLRSSLIVDLVGKNASQVKLRPAGRIALEWARLWTDVTNN